VPGWKTGLLIRRRKGQPHQFTFYLTRSPEETSLAELVRIAGQRWRIESCFEEAKGETGLDEYEVRSWTGWHRHITLSMLAHVYLTIVRRHAIGGRASRRAGRRAVAAHRAGGAPPALASGVGAAAFA
jgi:SRSO17 transposase